MGRITIDMTINAPVATVFAYVDDYRNTTKYMKDLVKWQPTGKVTHGKGAQFDVGMRAGPTTLTSVVDITTWTENKAIGWHSQRGVQADWQMGLSPKGERHERDVRHGVRVRRRHCRQIAWPGRRTDRARQPATLGRDAQGAHREVGARDPHRNRSQKPPQKLQQRAKPRGEKHHKNCNKTSGATCEQKRKTRRETLRMAVPGADRAGRGART